MPERDTGSILDGKYEMLERLATGGMGEVYKARHIHLQELRVIKILRHDRAEDPNAAQRFLQEARIATQIKHPNVAILYDYSRLPDGRFYMAWEYVDGEDVGARLRREGVFPLLLAVEMTIQALRGLEAIHGAGVIHRDISPDNLMMRKDPKGRAQLKIIDLGLAKSLATDADEITQAGVFMGKLRYCSPEQAGSLKGAPIDHRTDLYSLGTVLYEMVSGMPPFESENQHGFVLKRLSEEPLPLAGRNPQVRVPRELDQVVMRALQLDRDKRFHDAVEFIHGLVRVADSLRGAQTMELPMQTPAAAGAQSSPRPAPRSGPQSAPGAPRPIQRELSREERVDLLAQIDRAAKKVADGAQVVEAAQAAFDRGRIDEARRLAEQAHAINPKLRGLENLRGRLQELTDSAAREQQAAESQRLLERYLDDGKSALAVLALETLLDLRPNHPQRAELESRVAALGDAAQRQRRLEAAAAEARDALARGDLGSARRGLDNMERTAPGHELAATLGRELAEAEAREERRRDEEKVRARLETALGTGDLDQAERSLAELARMGLPRVSLDLYRSRFAEARSSSEAGAQAQEHENRFRERVKAQDWFGARDAIHAFERALPQSARPAQLLAEVSRLEELTRRHEAATQGVRQVELFLSQGKALEAELALKILLQMDPQTPNRARLEKQVKALWGA